jgi:hypothetical protein
MPAGRKPLGIHEQVDRLAGSPVALERLRVILANLAGELNVKEACDALGIEESRFFELKQRSLQRWALAMEPEKPGPRPTAESPDHQKIAELEHRIRHLELELKGTRLNVELASAGLVKKRRPSPESEAKKRRR